MTKLYCFLATLSFLLVACAGGSDDTNPAPVEPTAVDVAGEEVPTEVPPTATAPLAPTDTPELTEAPDMITQADAMAGIWLGTLAGEFGYVMYTPDGRYMLALSQDALATAPRVTGEYWFEDNQIHLRDLENAGHWTECDPDTVGIYDVLDLGDGQIAFQMVEDSCGDSGFTRGYVFGNMKQEWIAEPVEVVVP
jgi:hypothetical protein